MKLPCTGTWGYSLDGETFQGEYPSARAALDAGFEEAPGIPERVFAGCYDNPCQPSNEDLSSLVIDAIAKHINAELDNDIAADFIASIDHSYAAALGVELASTVEQWLRGLPMLACPVIDVIEESYEIELVIDDD